MNKYRVIALTSVLILGAGAFAHDVLRIGASAKPPEKFTKEFQLVLEDYSGKQVHLGDYRRKILIAYAWASWCPYCGAEIENLAKMKQTYGNDIQIIAINRAEPRSTAKAFTDKLQNTSGVVFLLDPTDSFFKDIDGYAMPETVFINNSGVVVYHHRGPLEMDQLETQVKQLLGR